MAWSRIMSLFTGFSVGCFSVGFGSEGFSAGRVSLGLFSLSLLACSAKVDVATPEAAGQPANATQAPAAPAAAASTAPSAPVSGPPTAAQSVLSAMDTSVDPCQDFFQYACGGWMANNPIPSDRARWARFDELAERNLVSLKSILEEAKNSQDPKAQKIGAFYGSCMDEASIEATGAKALDPLMARINGVQGPDGFMRVIGELHLVGINPLFGLGVDADYKKPEINIAHVWQGGLGLPDRDYYLKEDSKSAELRQAYVAHVAQMLRLAGQPQAAAGQQANAILAFETELAKAQMPRDQMRDPNKRYNKIDLKGLKKASPELNWDTYFKAIGYPGIKDINVAPPSFFTTVAKHIKKTPVGTLQAYLRWHLISDTARWLSKDFVDTNFAFYGQKLYGKKELPARWKRCARATDGAIGEILAEEYVKRQFAGDSKQIAVSMIEGIEAAFAAALPTLAWMDDETRKRALEKMHAITNKIGYPDRWRDYSSLSVGDRLFTNVMRANRFEFERQAKQVGQPVDKNEWYMTAPTVNAYYNPTGNEIVFPAGILQPPFFERSYPMAVNFGGIGMVMGHELTHGFDDSGRKFDGKGQLVEWWNESVSKQFEERAACVEELYGSYEVQPGLKLNGKLTLGENIADLGGIKEALGAYRSWKAKNPAAVTSVEGLTDEQLFFVGYGQIWCAQVTPEMEKVRVLTDTHSAPRFRVNGPLSQFPAFWEAFSCAPNTPMHPPKVCEVW